MKHLPLLLGLPVLLAGLLLAATSLSGQNLHTLTTSPSGDATYGWNTKYGPNGYGTGDTAVGIYLTFGGIYGNDRTVAIVMIPIAPLAGGTLNSATLFLQSNGFGTNYYYGSATLGWLDTGATPLSGDVVADGLGPISTALPSHWTLWNSDSGPGPQDGSPQLLSFDVTSYVQADLTVGRSFSTFVLSGSRETYGSVQAAESGEGPYIIANSSIPEPATAAILAGSLALALAAWRRRHTA